MDAMGHEFQYNLDDESVCWKCGCSEMVFCSEPSKCPQTAEAKPSDTNSLLVRTRALLRLAESLHVDIGKDVGKDSLSFEKMSAAKSYLKITEACLNCIKEKSQ